MAMAAVITPSHPTPEAPKMSMTSKEWIIPPRPKPGRKPATDTPPTKRKAQNRAAQRAFRERRAARVGELEQQLEEQIEAHEKHEAELKDQIHGLELDLQSFRSRCMLLENMLERERKERIRAETQTETLRRQSGDAYFRASSISGPPGHVNLQQHSAGRQSLRHSVADGRQPQHANSRNFSISQIVSPPHALSVNSQQHDDADVPLTCGNCSPSGPCACAEEVLASATSGCGKCGFGAPCQCLESLVGVADQQVLKRPPSPSNPMSSGKRHQPTASAALDSETNLTSTFAGKSSSHNTQHSLFQVAVSASQMPSSDSLPLKDRCGFCKDGTYCMCAEEAAMATPAMTPTAETLPPIFQQTQTPPPSEPDTVSPPLVMEMTADGAVKLPRRTRGARPHKKPTKANPGGCGVNGPGTCAQCQADPKSGLFCRLMAAKFDREQGGSAAAGAAGGGGGGCCGGKGAGGGCCKSRPAAEKITLPSLPSLGLSCAEAYQTLSSHRNFDRAADDIGSWLPKLKATTPTDSRHQNRHAVEVEAASIMSVLKEFDVRFGREC
ncbi:minimal binding motif of hap4 for binding to hap2/3/5 domain-containing protein [Hirsutella rhossiliensis]|uniref:Minimal binding motif of hap4 for binding to hap2/3/5 domain-containing protein n=1 Tax=Hirsutella rhossiliensis TaxID=111463 RepID=A0A9P8N741_9HYPO|nr:minimal binding motif of hap4 for binding to hap2/3/5 domain-containing protein [Hirsutella rhossiliensis]KAH0967974.1 minimal binding motif of hap4 for binding to hap2/3/5 domain-containing protein [Hirsutella rhossiliensis]